MALLSTSRYQGGTPTGPCGAGTACCDPALQNALSRAALTPPSPLETLRHTLADRDSPLILLSPVAARDLASPAAVMMAGAPQSRVLASLRYSHFTHGRAAKCDSGRVIKSAGGKNRRGEVGILMRPASPRGSGAAKGTLERE